MTENISDFPTDTPFTRSSAWNLCSAAPRRHQGSASSGETPGTCSLPIYLPNSAVLLPQGTHTWRRDQLVADQMVPPRLGQPPAGINYLFPQALG